VVSGTGDVPTPHRALSRVLRSAGVSGMDESGQTLKSVRIDSDPVALGLAPADAGPDPDVALEATYGWYWTADLLQAAGARVHLVHPSGLHWGARRVKNDQRDATGIAQRQRATICLRRGSPAYGARASVGRHEP
jgi:transposase